MISGVQSVFANAWAAIRRPFVLIRRMHFGGGVFVFAFRRFARRQQPLQIADRIRGQIDSEEGYRPFFERDRGTDQFFRPTAHIRLVTDKRQGEAIVLLFQCFHEGYVIAGRQKFLWLDFFDSSSFRHQFSSLTRPQQRACPYLQVTVLGQ
jgi:hypothetical protein